nr:MAG TPA: hypothetical protein [Caudoviricetes sp.]
MRLRVQGKTPQGKRRQTSRDVRHFREWHADALLSACQTRTFAIKGLTRPCDYAPRADIVHIPGGLRL